MLAVDGTEVVNGEFRLSFFRNLSHLVALGVLKGLDQLVNNIDEDDLVSRLVKELGNETATDVATTEVNCFLICGWCHFDVSVCEGVCGLLS